MSDPILGRLNTLRAVGPHPTGIGMLLDGGSHGEILLPSSYVPEDLQPGGEIEVFLSNDSEDRLVATTEEPYVMAGEFAVLEVVAATGIGAFLDWGMRKDLLLPFREQVRRLAVGDKVLVYVRVDDVSGRMVASSRLDRYLDATPKEKVSRCQKVSMLIAGHSDLGVKAIVDDRYWGLLPMSLKPNIPPYGTRCTGYISRVTEDGLVDLSLDPPGYGRVAEAAAKVTEALAMAEGGFLPLHDKSSPAAVQRELGMSKKVFKQAVGSLYRDKRIRITDEGIFLLGTAGAPDTVE